MSTQPAETHYEAAYMTLMRGQKEMDFCGPHVPSNLVLIGNHAFPLAMNSQGQVLMAASVYGRGRIVVLSHEGHFKMFPAMVENAVKWLRGDGSDDLPVGVHKNVTAVADSLRESSFRVDVVEGFSSKQTVGVYVTDAYSVSADPKELVAFLKAGGGMLIAGEAWSWAENHPEENALHHFGGNKVSGVAGIYFTEHPAEMERLSVSPQIPSSWMSVVIAKDFEDDLEFLLQGVPEFDICKEFVLSEVLVHGRLAFPIGTTEGGQVFLAGAYYGQGRVIVISHEGLLTQKKMAPFFRNAIEWLDEGRKGVIGFAPGLGDAFALSKESNKNCTTTHFRDDLSVFVCTAYSDKHKDEIQDFVAEGGGLLIGGHAWYWAQTHSGENPMTDFSGNKILNKMGLSLLRNIIPEGSFNAPVPSRPTKDTYHFCRLLHRFASHVNMGEQLTRHELKCLKKLGGHCSNFLRMNAHNSSSYEQVVSTLTDILKKSGMPQVCDSCPVKSAKDHLLLHVGTEMYKVCPNPDALLPFLIKDNPMLPTVNNSRIQINVNTKGGEEWISTGLYLSPGMKTYMSMPSVLLNSGWKVQIGCHTDKLKNEELKRAPCVSERFPITAEMMLVRNLWGGLIYLVAPPKTQVQGVQVTVQVAVPAPYYKFGVTTAADWSVLRSAPAPWAELEFENIILTVPSDVIRTLDHPDELASRWNAIMRAIADLAAIPHKFPRKERFVCDVQISYGWMHAGYPIMAHKPAAVNLVRMDLETDDLWGPIHELGHNQQRGCWEFPPHTTEGTCNLWSVYVHETVLGINREKAHPNITAKNRNKRMKQFAKVGKKLSSWMMWMALETYLQLQEKFGWDAFKKVFAAYHEMSKFPGDNKGKMNLYAETFSKTVGMNLCGFFKAWSWPIEAATEEKLSDLPPWADHPMVQFD
ncbi:TRPM8 channel-associated factor homolog [Echeneis naucrates]|uniref:TRPM8 channel-associated factor homolog n=1 Tax=Echeneis naucrates TaxID=173247 RepID=UPI0011145AD7|nr:TRPM8 channel-associated factor homolog [Echeneis naucrates]XP_029372778.1 TRPM8 channel-associated factor homolog [Echeneis naucrates]